MNTVFRAALTFVSSVSALYFVFWFGGALLLAVHAPAALSIVLALVAAVAAGRYVWSATATVQSGMVNSVMLGALVTGGIGFAGGFFGPIVFMPEANQGPLLGLFITGPLGCILGAVGGAVHWVVRGRQRLSHATRLD
ncbi:MAG: hypothetical protein U0Q11_19710 [Vicinamibacterales bacterium]